jgi:ubiquinone/menaquinone biosynthesis C-methylase UbiE
MSWYEAAIYDWFTQQSEKACLSAWRAELLKNVSGKVLEVGAGTGANLIHYGPSVEKLILAEPDYYMRQKLLVKLAEFDHGNVRVIHDPLESLNFPNATFDFVVGTLVLCSVKDLDRAVGEIYRVLRPGGGYVFLEHVAAENRPRRYTWQRCVEPLWKRVAGNCHLTRKTARAIAKAGFLVNDMIEESMRKTMPIFRPTIRGVAYKPIPTKK